MKISQSKITKILIQFDVKSKWVCNNCGHQEISVETVNITNIGLFESEFVWCLVGSKQRSTDCPECQDTMLILPIDDSFFVDLTPFQEQGGE